MRSYTQYLNQARKQQRSLCGAVVALVCLFSLAAATPAFAAKAGSNGETLSFTRGDLNDDGAVNFEDLILAIEYFEGRGRLPVIETLDVLDDGEFTESDLFGLAHIASVPGSGFLPERMQIMRGDLNDDGSVDLADSRILEAYLEHGGRIRDTALDAADLDNNGVIDSRDMASLYNKVGRDHDQAASQGRPDTDVDLLDSDGDGAQDIAAPDFSGTVQRDRRVKGDNGRNPRVIDYPAPIDRADPRIQAKSDKGSLGRGGFTTSGPVRGDKDGGSDKGAGGTARPQIGSTPDPVTRSDTGTKGAGISGQPPVRSRAKLSAADSDEPEKVGRQAKSPAKKRARR
jgi:hypothetical protein